MVSEEIGVGFGFASSDVSPDGVRVGEGYDTAGLVLLGDM